MENSILTTPSPDLFNIARATLDDKEIEKVVKKWALRIKSFPINKDYNLYLGYAKISKEDKKEFCFFLSDKRTLENSDIKINVSKHNFDHLESICIDFEIDSPEQLQTLVKDAIETKKNHPAKGTITHTNDDLITSLEK